MLEDYAVLQQEKEEEKRRSRVRLQIICFFIYFCIFCFFCYCNLSLEKCLNILGLNIKSLFGGGFPWYDLVVATTLFCLTICLLGLYYSWLVAIEANLNTRNLEKKAKTKEFFCLCDAECQKLKIRNHTCSMRMS